MKRPLFLLLPLLLGGLVADSSTSSSAGKEGQTPSTLDSTYPSSSRRLSDQRRMRKVAEDEYKNNTVVNPTRPSPGVDLPRSATVHSASADFINVTNKYINDTYQNMTISMVTLSAGPLDVGVGGVKFCNTSEGTGCTASDSAANDEHFDRVSKPSENVTQKGSDSSRIQVLSQVREGDVNKSGIIKQESTMKSSLGSVDVVVPSLTGAGRGEAGPPGGAQGRNRTQFRQGRTDAPMLNYIFDTYSTLNKHSHRNDRYEGPRIESPGVGVEADTEAETHLDCTVASLQDKLVSWVRRKPDDDSLEILTIGQQTFTADQRISVEYLPPHTWRLALRGARPDDSGEYECQLSTHPPLISRHHLLVHPPVVELADSGGAVERDKYYERNSTLVLGCRVRHLPTAARGITWRHRDRVLNDDTQRGGVSVKTEEAGGGADSTLLVARLAASDSGRYSCSVRGPAARLLQASVNVHVLNEESLAELHQGSASSAMLPSRPIVLVSQLFSLASTLTAGLLRRQLPR